MSAPNAPRTSAIRSMAPALRPHWRAVRVAVLGAASLVLATSAHVIGGGATAFARRTRLTALVLGLVAVPLTGRRCRTAVLVAVLGVQQSCCTWCSQRSQSSEAASRAVLLPPHTSSVRPAR